MKSINPNELSIEEQEKYGEIIQKYNITNIFYIEEERDKLDLTDLEVDGYLMRMSKTFKNLFPIKKYFTIVMESKSRENIISPYWNFRILILDNLLDKKDEIK